MKSLFLTVFLVCSLGAILPATATAACVNSNRQEGEIGSYNYIKYVFNSSVELSSSQKQAFKNGAEDWNECDEQGQANSPTFPWIVAPSESVPGNSNEVLSIVVRQLDGPDSSNPQRCATRQGSLITLYKNAQLPSGSTIDCLTNPILKDTAFHELGHVLGFNDADGSCTTYGMADTGFTSQGAYINRIPKSQECSTAEANYQTPSEEDEDEDPCSASHTHPECEEPLANDPLVIDMRGDGFSFTSVANSPVFFDFDADGRLEASGWTSVASDDAFLVLDVNRNGLIDDGEELFGNVMRSPNDGRTNLHGYLALGEYDNPVLGGNGDGTIDRRDSIWRSLLLWRDRNSDGKSQANELRLVKRSRLVEIGLAFARLGRKDKHGNRLFYTGHAWLQGKRGLIQVETTDVLFLGIVSQTKTGYRSIKKQ